MRRRYSPLLAGGFSYCLACVMAAALAVISPLCAATTVAKAASSDSSPAIDAASAYGKLPLSFEVNQGQTDSSVRFLARGAGFGMFLTSDAAVITLSAAHAPIDSEDQSDFARSAVLRIRFVGANLAPEISGEVPLPDKSNYFIGDDRARHITDIAHFAQVRYGGLYPGIDLVYYGDQRKLEYDFVLAPGADPSQIAIAFDGANEVNLDATGDLILRTPLGDLKQHHPNIYQVVNGKREPIGGRYVRLSANELGLEVAAHDASKSLVIDPVLSYSTFLGGSSNDFANAITVDNAGNAYIAGYTSSTNFPVVNPYSRSLGRSATNVFVSKLNPTGTALVYSTYLGGSSETDYATGIAVDSAGNAYVTGTTTGSGFPTTTGSYQKGTSGGGSFVAKLGAAGNTLTYSTYVLNASAKGIAVDGSSYAYVTGSASSGFATTAGAFQTATHNSSSTNAFILKLNTTGTAATFATFLGGSGTDVGNGVAVDSGGNAYVGGSTTSTNFPLTNALQTSLGGQLDGFVAKVNATGSALVYSTYLGGTKDDSVNAIAVDASGSAYVAGETYSANFPVSVFAYQFNKTGGLLLNSIQGVGFVSKLTAAGNGLAYSTFLGGEICDAFQSPCSYFQPPPETPGDAAYGIAVDNQGHAYVTGIARTYTFPLVDSLLPAKTSDNQDSLFVTKVAQAGNALLYSDFVRTGTATTGNTPGGLPYDAGKAIAVDSNGSAYGASESVAGFPTTTGAFQTSNAGLTDAVAFKLTSTTGQMSLAVSPNPAVAGQAIALTATVPGGASNGSITFITYAQGFNQIRSVPLSNGTATTTLTLTAGIDVLTAIYRNGTNVADTPLLYQVVNPPAVCN
jgi:Beta-propeller repeat